MLTAEEINEIEREASHYPRREAVSIDALKIVQRTVPLDLRREPHRYRQASRHVADGSR
jgi:hypothetical protein